VGGERESRGERGEHRQGELRSEQPKGEHSQGEHQQNEGRRNGNDGEWGGWNGPAARVGGGALWKDVDEEAGKFGLAMVRSALFLLSSLFVLLPFFSPHFMFHLSFPPYLHSSSLSSSLSMHSLPSYPPNV
jgi:hypothetical protein